MAAQENVIVIRFFEAMQIINRVEGGTTALVPEDIEQSEAGSFDGTTWAASGWMGRAREPR